MIDDPVLVLEHFCFGNPRPPSRPHPLLIIHGDVYYFVAEFFRARTRTTIEVALLSHSTLTPQLFLNEIAGFETSPRPYLLKYGAFRHPDVIGR